MNQEALRLSSTVDRTVPRSCKTVNTKAESDPSNSGGASSFNTAILLACFVLIRGQPATKTVSGGIMLLSS